MPHTVPTMEELASVQRDGEAYDASQDLVLRDLAARVGALEVRNGGPGPKPPWVGATIAPAAGSSDYQAPWDALDAAAGPLRVTRTFDSTIKAVGSERWRKVQGPLPFYSVKPPNGDVAGFIDGVYSDEYQEMVEALPAGSRLAVYHEPEDNLSGVTFRDLTERAVNDLRAARPTGVTFCVVNMEYQYKTNSKGLTITPDGQLQPGWLDAALLADEIDLDVYASGPDDDGPIRTSGGAQRWLDLLVAEAKKPWGIAERGIYAHPGRVKMLFDDWRFLCENGAVLFLYWNAKLQQYEYPLVGGELDALRAIASQGRAR